MTFDATGDLAVGVEYTARVTTAAKDVAGNPLASETVWSFTVAAAPPGGGGSPVSVTVIVGAATGGSAASLAADDDDYYVTESSSASTKATAWYGTFTAVPRSLASLRISFTGKHSLACAQGIALRRWSDNSWVVVQQQTVGPTEVAIVDFAPSGPLGGYVSGTGAEGELQVRIRCTTTAGTFVSSADLLRIAYDS
jgi:hypothetical protein